MQTPQDFLIEKIERFVVTTKENIDPCRPLENNDNESLFNLLRELIVRQFLIKENKK